MIKTTTEGICFMKNITTALFVLNLIIMSGTSSAGLMSAVDPVSPSAESSCNLNFTCGWSFTVDASIDVLALGQWDEGLDGLNGSADVGLWLDDGTLLVSATVPTGSTGTLVGDHRYTSITALTLMTSTLYVIGSAYTGGQSDNLASTEFHPLINPFSGREAGGGTSPDLQFPNFQDTRLFSGPSFLFERSVPVPATLALFGLGLAGLGWSRRKKV
jgi:hypothetical protein